MRTETAGQRIARGAMSAGSLATSLLNRARIALKEREEAKERIQARQAGPTIAERQDDLSTFYTQYEDLVEVLCDAAQYGPTPKLVRQYEAHRVWMHANYPRLRPFLGAFLRMDTEELGDGFEALVAAEDLATFLATDDGHMIARITRTREALNLYGEHLRQLAARTV